MVKWHNLDDELSLSSRVGLNKQFGYTSPVDLIELYPQFYFLASQLTCAQQFDISTLLRPDAVDVPVQQCLSCDCELGHSGYSQWPAFALDRLALALAVHTPACSDDVIERDHECRLLARLGPQAMSAVRSLSEGKRT
jgi:hypothetical protein